MASIANTTWNQDVYEPSDDTFALVDALEQELPAILADGPPRVVAEVGCGSGFVICSAALLLRAAAPRAAALLAAVDVNEAALGAAAATLSAHGVGDSVELLRCDLLGPLAARLEGAVDLLLFNPPYVPTPDDEVARGGIAAAWAGGARGRRVIDRLLPRLPALLSPRGRCLMVTVAENDPAEIIRQMEGRGLTGSVVLRRGADEEALQIVCLRRGGAGRPEPSCGGGGGREQQAAAPRIGNGDDAPTHIK